MSNIWTILQVSTGIGKLHLECHMRTLPRRGELAIMLFIDKSVH
jgi:hypothetical protein